MRMYVGNLPYSTTDSELHDIFSAHGQVDDAKVITDRETGRSRGFGFVEMKDETQAKAAMEALNGHSIDGRALVVNEAREREPRGGGGGGGGGYRGGGGGGRW